MKQCRIDQLFTIWNNTINLNTYLNIVKKKCLFIYSQYFLMFQRKPLGTYLVVLTALRCTTPAAIMRIFFL